MRSTQIGALVTAALIAGASAPARALDVVAEDHWIIVTGSRTERETQAQLTSVQKAWPKRVEKTPGYPRVERSDGKTGLNPGFVIVVAGVCPDERAALAVRDALRKTFPGTYVRAVARYLAGPIPHCPNVKPPRAAPPPVAEEGEEITLDGEEPAGATGLRWQLYSIKSECGDGAIVRLLGRRGEVLDERREPAHCVHGDPEDPGSGESRTWSASVQGSYVMLTSMTWAYDTGCSGGFALCPGPDGIREERLEGACNSGGPMPGAEESHCGE